MELIFLAESTIAKKASYVFGHVINALIDVGYDNINLQVCLYINIYYK